MASYMQDNKGKWHVRFRVHSKQKHLSGFNTKREAINAYDLFPKDKGIDEKKMPTFSELFRHFTEYKKGKVKDSTISLYKNIYSKHLQKFVNFKIDKIKTVDIIEWQRELNNKGLGFNIKENCWSVLQSAFTFARIIYKVESPLNDVDKFRNLEPKKEMQFWTIEEFEEFINVIPEKDIIYKTFFMTLFYLGLRKGEALALAWRDIDFRNAKCRISKTYTRRTLNESTYQITAPKSTSSNRTILIPEPLLVQLELLKKQYELASNRLLNPNWFIFGLEHPIVETMFAF